MRGRNTLALHFYVKWNKLYSWLRLKEGVLSEGSEKYFWCYLILLVINIYISGPDIFRQFLVTLDMMPLILKFSNFYKGINIFIIITTLDVLSISPLQHDIWPQLTSEKFDEWNLNFVSFLPPVMSSSSKLFHFAPEVEDKCRIYE